MRPAPSELKITGYIPELDAFQAQDELGKLYLIPYEELANIFAESQARHEKATLAAEKYKTQNGVYPPIEFFRRF